MTITTRMIADALETIVEAVAKAVGERLEAREAQRELPDVLRHLSRLLVAKGYRPQTIEKYVACVLRFMTQSECPGLPSVTAMKVVTFLETQRGATQRLHLAALRTVFDRVLGRRLTRGIRYVPRPVPRMKATREQVLAVDNACKTDQERFVVGMLNRANCLPCQLRLAVRPVLSAGPGAPAPIRFLPDNTPGADWFLPSSRQAGPISTRTIRRIVKRLSEACGFHLTCTALRLGPTIPFRAA